MKKLIIMKGLSNAGKSTLVETLAKIHRAFVVCPDVIREIVHGTPFRAESEHIIWAEARTMVLYAFKYYDTVILDSTMVMKEYRDRWISSKWTREFHILNTPKDVCIARAESNGRDDLVPVIEAMASQWETVTKKELRDGETLFNYHWNYHRECLDNEPVEIGDEFFF